MLNKLLERQVRTHLGDGEIPAAVSAFLESVSQSFDAFEQRINVCENAVEEAKQHLWALNEKLEAEKEELKNTHRELTRIFNHVNEGFFTKNLVTGEYIHMSVGCEKIYGYSQADFYANTWLWFQVIHPDDRYIIDEETDLLNSGRQILSCYRIFHKDKSIRWIEVKAIPFLINEKLVRVDGVVNDVTERKSAEQLLKDSEVKFRSFFENSMDGILLSKPNGIILEANPAACEIFRATENQIKSYSHDQLLAFGEPSQIDNFMEQRRLTGRFKGEITLFRSDQTMFMAEVDSGLFKDGYGDDRTFIIVRDIEDRKKAEAEILMSERQLDLIYNTVTDSISMFSIEGENCYKFLSVNTSFLEASGLDKDHVIGKYLTDVIPEPSVSNMLAKFNEATILKKPMGWEEQIPYPTGIKTGILSINPVVDDNGNCIRIICSIHDITERKEKEEAIRRSEQDFQSLVNNIDGIVWKADGEKLQLSFVSDRAESLLGYPVAEWVNTPDFWQKHLYDEDREAAVSFSNRCIDEKKSHEFEYRMVAADGKLLWLHNYVSVIIDDDGSLYLRGIMVDITAGKKSEQALKDGEEKYRSVVEQASDAIFISRPKGNLIDVNKSGCEMLGYTKEEFSNMNLFEMIPDLKPRDKQQPGRELLMGGIVINEGNLAHKNGLPVPVDITAKMLSDGRIIAIVRNITERRLAERNNRESIERFQRLSQATHDCIWEWNLLTDEVWWNESFYKLLGYDKDMPIPALFEWTKKMHPADRDKIIVRLKSVRKNTFDFWEDEFRYKTESGDYGTALDRAYVLRDDAGVPIRVIGAIVDITERKKTEQQIKDSEQRYRTLFEQNLAGIYQTTITGEILTCNNAFYEMLGYSPSHNLLPQSADQLYYNSGDRDVFIKEIRKQKKLLNYESILKNRAGNPLHIIENISLYQDPVTKEEILEGIMLDITERKNAEAKLRDSEERYRQIVETAQEGIWVLNRQHETLFVNKKLCEILEYPLDEMIGKRNLYFMLEEDKETAMVIMQKTKNGISENFDFRFVTKTGKHIWANLSVSPIFDSGQAVSGVLAMVTDITKRKLNEVLLKKSERVLDLKNKELERKNKELEQFAYVASHDLQEPLRTTTSFVKLLKQQYSGKLDDKAEKYLGFIVDSSDRMKTLIKDLLDYSRIGNQDEMIPVDCNEILNNVKADLHRAIKDAGAKIISENLPVIMGYPTDIKQLFQNLLINAIKFCKRGTIPLISISAKSKEGYWHFSFTDNGIGIDSVHTDRIFIIFQRLHTRTEYQGSGIGLSHCKKIVELHNGKIWVESELGEGSTFYFTIPESNAVSKAD